MSPLRHPTRNLIGVLAFSFIALCGAAEKISFQLEPGKEPGSTTLTIRTAAGQTFQVEHVHPSERPLDRWSPDALYQPDTAQLLVPMADCSYHLYQLGSGRLELQCILEGGARSLGPPGSHDRTRACWQFTRWTAPHVLRLESDHPAGVDASLVMQIDVDLEASTLHYLNAGGAGAFALRRLDAERMTELHFKESTARLKKP